MIRNALAHDVQKRSVTKCSWKEKEVGGRWRGEGERYEEALIAMGGKKWDY